MSYRRNRKTAALQHYAYSQPWLEKLLSRTPDADDVWAGQVYDWMSQYRGSGNTPRVKIYITSNLEGSPEHDIRDLAQYSTNDAWVFEKILFTRRIGDIEVEHKIKAIQPFAEDEKDILRNVGRLSTQVTTHEALTCGV